MPSQHRLIIEVFLANQLNGPSTNIDTGGACKNERNDPRHTGDRRPEKQGCFLCRDTGLQWCKDAGAHSSPAAVL